MTQPCAYLWINNFDPSATLNTSNEGTCLHGLYTDAEYNFKSQDEPLITIISSSIKQASIINMIRTPTHSRNAFATFYDLPGELRNEIYPTVLQYEKEQYIKLKRKFSSNGIVYIKFPQPPLSHAIPLLRHEVLSIYYNINTFRVSIKTKQQRETFRAWVGQLGRVLAGLQRLKMMVMAPISRPKFRYYRRDDLICTLNLANNKDGQPTIEHSKRGCLSNCVCWFDALVEAGLQRSRSMVGASSNEQQQKPPTAASSNPVINLSLKLCDILDMTESQALKEESKVTLNPQHQDAMHSGADDWYRAMSYPVRYVNSSILYLRSLSGIAGETKSSCAGDQQQTRRRRTYRPLGSIY